MNVTINCGYLNSIFRGKTSGQKWGVMVLYNRDPHIICIFGCYTKNTFSLYTISSGYRFFLPFWENKKRILKKIQEVLDIYR